MPTFCLVHRAAQPQPDPSGADPPPERMLLVEAFHLRTTQPQPRVTLENFPVPLSALVQRLPDAEQSSGRVFAVVADMALLRYARNVAIRFKFLRLKNSLGAAVRFDCEADFEHFWALQKDFLQFTASEGRDPPPAQENDPLIYPPIIAIDSAQTRVKDDAVACWKDGDEIVLRSYAAWVIRDADVSPAFASISGENSSNPLTILEVLPSPLREAFLDAFNVQVTSHDGAKKKKVFEDERGMALNGDAPDRRALVFETRFNARTLDELVQHRKFFITKDRISYHLSAAVADDFTRWFSRLTPVCPRLPEDVQESLLLLARLGKRHSPVVQTRDTLVDPRYAVESDMSLSEEDGVTHKFSVFGRFGEAWNQKPQELLSGKKFFREFLHQVISTATKLCPVDVSFPEENASLLQHPPFVDNLSDAGRSFLQAEIKPRMARGETAFHYDVAAALTHSLRRGEQSYAKDLLGIIDPQRRDAPGGFSVVMNHRIAFREIEAYQKVDLARQRALLDATKNGPITDFQKAMIYLANPTPIFAIARGVGFDLQRQRDAKEAQLNNFPENSPERIGCQADCDALKWLLESASKPVKSPKSKWDGSKACRHYLSALSQLLMAVLLQRNGGLVTADLLRETSENPPPGFTDVEQLGIKAHLAECLLREAERLKMKKEEECHILRALLNSDKVPPAYQLLSVAYVKEFNANTNTMKVWVEKLDCLVEVSAPRWNTPVGFGSQVQFVAEFKELNRALTRPLEGVAPTLLSGGTVLWFPHPNGNRNEFVLQAPNRLERECRVSLHNQPLLPPDHLLPKHVKGLLFNELNRVPFPASPKSVTAQKVDLVCGRLVGMREGRPFAFLKPNDGSQDVYLPATAFRGRFRSFLRNAILTCTAYLDGSRRRRAAWAELQMFSGKIDRCLPKPDFAFITPDSGETDVYFKKRFFLADPSVTLQNGLKVKFIARNSEQGRSAVWVTAAPPSPEQSAERERAEPEGDVVEAEPEPGPEMDWEDDQDW